MELPLSAPPVAGEWLPISLSQRDVWLDQMTWPGSCHLNIGGGAFLDGPIDIARLRATLQQLVAETEALRLVPLADGRQYLLANYTAELTEIDFTHLADAAEVKRVMQSWWQTTIADRFPGDGRPPWRFFLLKSAFPLYGLTIQFHHSIMDGWGTTQIMRRWCALYNSSALESPLPHALPYRQFIDETNLYRHSTQWEKDRDFWREQAHRFTPPLFESRHNGSAAGLPAAHLHSLGFPRALYQRLQTAAAARKLTPFSIILAALALYFQRTRLPTEGGAAAPAQITIGVPTLNRSGNRFMATAGMFVGVLPIAIEIAPDDTLANLADNAQRKLRAALRHSRYPLGEISSDLKLLRENRSAPFDILLSFERQDYTLDFGATPLIESRQLFSGIARFPLGITLCEFAADRDLEWILEGSASCFEGRELDWLGHRLIHLVGCFIDQPDQLSGTLDLLPAAERQAILEATHRHARRHAHLPSFIEQFEAQAARMPAACALVWADGQLDYGQLLAQSRQFALRLLHAGLPQQAIVALALERSPAMIVALLGIARAGAAFLPLDPHAPGDRLRRILVDSAAHTLVIESADRLRFDELPCALIEIDEGNRQHPPATLAPPAWPLPAPDDLAYVLYTSGSTGEPKGVMIEHIALARRLAWLDATYRIVPQDRSAQATQATFDPALIEILLPLTRGASVALPPAGKVAGDGLVDFALHHHVTVMAFVPSTLERFTAALAHKANTHPRLRVACCGGEVLDAELANRFIAATGARLFNVYGPTETVIFATAWPCSIHAQQTVLPIGRAIDDTRIYVLDAQQRLLPFGERGEIYIGGGCLARGYLKRPQLDREYFCDDPYDAADTSGNRVPRMYRTGDAGWLDCDGTLHFAGRLDRQLKLRGYRIEPGEIEAAILSFAGVERCVVKLLPPASPLGEQKILHAWVVLTHPTKRLDRHALDRHLRARLPDYMLPAGVTAVVRMPELSTGKIDLAALPVPLQDPLAAVSRAPTFGLESEIRAAWSQALGKPIDNALANFFTLGGDSLAVIDTIAILEKRIGRRLSLQLIVDNPTIERLAQALERSSEQHPALLPLAGMATSRQHDATQTLPPLFLVASGHGDLLRFQALAAVLADRYTPYMLQPPGAMVDANLEALAQNYANHIHRLGVRHASLAGFSIGGITALATARTLESRNIDVTDLYLIDTLYPHALLRARKIWRFFEWITARLHLQELSLNGRRISAILNDAGLLLQINALADFKAEPYAGRTLLIKSSGLLFWQRWLFAPWRRQLQRLHEIDIPGLHGSIFEPGNLEALAAALHPAPLSANPLHLDNTRDTPRHG